MALKNNLTLSKGEIEVLADMLDSEISGNIQNLISKCDNPPSGDHNDPALYAHDLRMAVQMSTKINGRDTPMERHANTFDALVQKIKS